jgi:hypothetical protein
MIPQNPEQGRIRRHIHLNCLAVHVQRNHSLLLPLWVYSTLSLWAKGLTPWIFEGWISLQVFPGSRTQAHKSMVTEVNILWLPLILR